jgi:hypothetical protein
MPIFQGFADRFRGTVALALQQRLAEDIDRLIGQLFEAALALWEQNGWLTYDREEENCTVQLYRWCKVACQQDRRFAFFVPHLEWVNLTAAILAGTESVMSANRPDLRIEIGEVGRAVECKRLAPTAPWPRAYVYKGLARFVVDNYGHGENVGYMVGYIQAGTFAEVLTKINQQVTGHPNMGAAQTLTLLRDEGTSSWNRSCHSRSSGLPIRIDHLHVNVTQV